MKRLAFLLAALLTCSCAQNFPTRHACLDGAERRFLACRAGCGDGIFRHSCLGCDNGLAMDRTACGNGFFQEDGNI